jgi:hypothetical protein
VRNGETLNACVSPVSLTFSGFVIRVSVSVENRMQ